MANETVKATNEQMEEALGVVPHLTGRPQRSPVVGFWLGQLQRTLTPVVEQYQHDRRRLSKSFAQLDGAGEVIYARNDKGLETGNFSIRPSLMDEHREMARALSNIRCTVHVGQVSAKALWDSMEPKKEEDRETWGGVPPALFIGLGPFLDVDLPDVAKLLPAEVEVDDEAAAVMARLEARMAGTGAEGGPQALPAPEATPGAPGADVVAIGSVAPDTE